MVQLCFGEGDGGLTDVVVLGQIQTPRVLKQFSSAIRLARERACPPRAGQRRGLFSAHIERTEHLERSFVGGDGLGREVQLQVRVGQLLLGGRGGVVDAERGEAAACTLEIVQRAVVLALVERQASEVLLDFGLGHLEAALRGACERLLVQTGGFAEAVLHRERDGDVVFDLC